MKQFLSEICKRKVHLIAFGALTMIAIDAFFAPPSRPAILGAMVWATMYAAASISILWFIVKGSLRSLQWMTAIVSFVGLFRGVGFFLYDQRLTPMGLNVVIAAYAYLVHLHERSKLSA